MAENPENNREIQNAETSQNSPETASGAAEQRFFKIKKMRFNDKDCHIVTQDLNGPCPLLAIVNVLVLKGAVTLPPPPSRISSEGLLVHLSNYILSREPSNEKDKEIYQANMGQILELIPTLVKGLDVNVKFSAVDAFEFTAQLSLFDLVSMKLYHVWLADPEEEVSKIKFSDRFLREYSYNTLTIEVVKLEDTDEKKLYLRNFLEETASQFTFHGFKKLLETMKDGELAVLFQNNHFSTIFKRRDEIFKLVTDEGYLDQPTVVWETVSVFSPDTVFVDSNFHTFKPQSVAPPPSTVTQQPCTSSSTVIHRTSEIQIDEIGEEAAEEPCLVPPGTVPYFGPAPVPALPSSAIAATPTSGTPRRQQFAAATVTQRSSQEKKCVVM